MFLWDEDAYSALIKTRGEDQIHVSASAHLQGQEDAIAASVSRRAEAEKTYSRISMDKLETEIEALDYYPRVTTGVSGFVPGNVVELAGHSGCGKSQMLLHALANAVSMGVRVTLIDTSMRFSPERFRAILQHNVKLMEPQDERKARETVDLWMMAFNVIRCPGGSIDLITALSSLIIPVSSNSSKAQEFHKIPLRIIAVDTINEFFWEDISEGAIGDMKQQSVQAAIERLRNPAQRAVILCTRLVTKSTPTMSATNGKYVYAIDSNTVYVADKRFHFCVEDTGVEFISDQQMIE